MPDETLASARLVRASTADLDPAALERLRAFLDEAYGSRFDDRDWGHTLGGTHLWLESGGEVLSHAAVVRRFLATRSRELSTGYVEAVATRENARRRGLGARVMRAAAEVIQSDFELGALSSNADGFYEKLGWETWRGPTFVCTETAWSATPDDDGGVMILRTKRTLELDRTEALSCEWRDGDVW